MHKLEIPSLGIIREFPENIQECTKEQYIAFAKANLPYLNGKMSLQEVKITLVYDFLDIKRTLDIPVALENEDPALDHILQIADLLDSFYTVQEQNGTSYRAIKNESIQNHIPTFSHNNVSYYGPEAALKSITYGQYLEANNAYQDYATYKEERYLDLLVAILYTTENKVFNSKEVEKISLQFKDVDHGIKYGIYLFFGACIKWISTQTELPMSGGASIDLTVLFEKPKNNNQMPKGIGMLNSLFELAEIGVFGDVEETGNTPLYTVLVYLANKTIEARKNKRNVTN